MALRLRDVAIELFQFTMSRDTFTTKRKACALGMLRYLSKDHEIPEAYRLSIDLLTSKKRETVFAATEFLKQYADIRDHPSDAEVVTLLDTIFTHTQNRSVAVSVLNLQIKTGHMYAGCN